jgi:hypothetical protein
MKRPHNRFPPFLLLQIILLLAFMSLTNPTGNAQDEALVLEWEQHWPTYGVGGTCNFGTHNFFVGDVDGDGVVEFVTGGMTYRGDYHDASEVEAPFGIWNWDGQNFTLEAYHTWKGLLRTIYAADLDGDGKPEIITGGYASNLIGRSSLIQIWSWDNKDLVLRSSFDGVSASSIHVGDLDGDGKAEIFAAGTMVRNGTAFAQLCILRWDGETISLVKSYEWGSGEGAGAKSVRVSDLDNDGVLEVVTGGYDHGLTNSSGQLRVWQWDGEDLVLKANEEWRLVEDTYGVTVTGDPMGNTLVENVKVGDLDGDGVVEIVSGGFAFDREKMNAQLGVWRWSGSSLVLEETQEWFVEDITEVKAVALDDVDGDGRLEVLVSGGTAVYGGFDVDTQPEAAFLTVWSWDGDVLELICEEDWTVGEGVFAWNVGTGDVDGDGVTEIVTVGCMYVNQLCDPDLRIWSMSTSESGNPFEYVVFVIAGVAVTVLVAVGLYFGVKKRK